MPVCGPAPTSKEEVNKIYEECLAVLKNNKILLGEPIIELFAKHRNERYAKLYLAIHDLVELNNWESW